MRVISHLPWYTTFRSIRLATSQDISLYALLDVERTASANEIKRAFRQKAKLHHPDLKGSQHDTGHFAKILVAYQVLSNDRQRQLYDLSMKTDSRTVRNAAEQESSQSSGPTQQDKDEWVPGDGWFAWATKTPHTAPANQLDRLRAELRTEFNAAVRHAYLGPRLQVGAGELPEAFEGEERSVPGVGDVMQLVSGRQLLGVVRERQDLRLPGGSMHPCDNIMRHADSGATNSNGGSEPSLRSSDSQSCQQGCQTEHSEAVPTAAASRPGSTILELLIEDKPVAVAVRQKHRSSPAEQATASHAMPSDTSWNWSEDREGSAAHTVDRGPATADQQQAAFSSNACWTQIFSTEGEQLAAEREGMVYKGGWPGPQTHSLLKGQTPLVRHMHIVTTASGGQELSVCRCRRAWLPPATTWLFPPRSQDHASGGWYFEWSGHGLHRHPAWLHPAVFVLLAGFETLYHESLLKSDAQIKQPMHPKATRQEAPSRTQEAKQWLRSILRFHNKQG